MTKTIRSPLFLLSVIVSAAPLVGAGRLQTTPVDIRGVYTGRYVCNQRQISLQLTLEPKGPSALSGVFAFYTPGTDPAQPLGAFRVDGTFDARSGAFRLQPTSWVKAAPGHMTVALSGRYEASSGKLTGTIQGAGCSTFDATRDATATRQAAADATAREQQFANAPTALSEARDPAEQCLVIGKWYSRFRNEYADMDILQSLADDAQMRSVNLFLDEEFVPVFGKPFDRMQDPERHLLMLMIRGCADRLTDRGDHFMYQNPLQRAFRVAPDTISLLTYRRTLRQQKQQLLQELSALSASEQALKRVALLRDAELETYEVLWPSEYTTLTEAVEDAAVRLAAPALDAWVSSVIAGASGYDGLASVMAARKQLTGVRQDPAVPAGGRRVSPGARPGAGAPQSGSPESFMASASPEDRAGAEAKLRARAETLVAELVVQDRTDPAAARVLAAAAEEARSVTNFCKTLSAGDVGPDKREPSTRDLCMALADQFDGVDRLREGAGAAGLPLRLRRQIRGEQCRHAADAGDDSGCRIGDSGPIRGGSRRVDQARAMNATRARRAFSAPAVFGASRRGECPPDLP